MAPPVSNPNAVPGPKCPKARQSKKRISKNDLWRKKELELAANKPYGLSADFNHSFINYKSTTIEISNCNYSLLIVRVIICPKVIFFFNSAHGTVLHQGSRMRKIVQFGGHRNIEFLFFISRKKKFLFFSWKIEIIFTKYITKKKTLILEVLVQQSV